MSGNMDKKNKKILFITPPYHCGVVEVAGVWPPLGFLFLGNQAEKAGWSVEIYDAMSLRHSFEAIRENLSKKDFDILATSAITPTYPDAELLCRLAKEVKPDCTTLMGGVHPTFCFNDILKSNNCSIDYILKGEGEQPIYNFLKEFDSIEKRHETPNLVYKDGNNIVSNRSLPFIDDINNLEAAWHLLNWDDYKYFVIPNSRLGAISTSRGCCHECTFCSQQKFWKKSWRGRSPESVANEIKYLNESYGLNVFLFTDEYPTYDRDRWEELLDRIIVADLDIYILIETRVEDIVRDKDILSKYRRAGIIHVYVGAEATDQDTLDKINKEISVGQSKEAIRLIAEYGMISETSFVLGFPEETKESIENTFQLAREFNPDFAHFLAITPWPYSDLYQEMKNKIETEDYRLYNLIEPIIKPDFMTRDEVDLAIIDCYRRFYMPKMIKFLKESNPFRRNYLVTSTKLIMKSSFLINKFARLGINPKTIMKSVIGS